MGWSDLGSATKRNILIVILATVVPSVLLGWVRTRHGFPTGRNLPMLKPEGCAPFMKFTCPPHMMCIVDFTMETYGRCECNRLVGYVRRLPTFDDGEVDDPFTYGIECGPDYMVTIPMMIVTLPMLFSLVMFAKVSLMTLWNLVKQNEKFKWNSTTRGLVLLMLCHWSPIGTLVARMVMFLGLDPYEWWWNEMSPIFQSATGYFYNVCSYELTISWLDLVERTVKMSRTSSKGIVAAKWFLRIVNVVVNIYLDLFHKWDRIARTRFNTFIMIQHLVLNLGPGIILKRMLCKDSKDVTNPNWKASEVIKRTCLINFQAQIVVIAGFEAINYLVYPEWYRHGFGVYYFYMWVMFASVMLSWGWLHYILFGCRKLLQESDSDKISQYFGFTTIGLNSTLVSGVSRFSSTNGSVASMASAASTVEKASTVEADADAAGAEESKA